MSKDEKQIQVVFHFRYRLEIYNAFIMTQYQPIPVGSSSLLPLAKIVANSIIMQPATSKDSKEKRVFSTFFQENFQHPEALEFQVFICMEGQDAVKHSQLTYFIKIFQYKKKQKCTSMNLWEAFTHNYFCCKSRKKDMIQLPWWPKKQQRGFVSCIQMNCK